MKRFQTERAFVLLFLLGALLFAAANAPFNAPDEPVLSTARLRFQRDSSSRISGMARWGYISR